MPTKHHLTPGQRIPETRWRYIRDATPGTRGGRKLRRGLCECVCGERRLVFVESLVRPPGKKESRGCGSTACAALYRAQQELAQLDYPATRDEVTSTLRYLYAQLLFDRCNGGL